MSIQSAPFRAAADDVNAASVLGGGARRYSELRRAIDGISSALTLTLRSLESDGLVTRTVTPSTPSSARLSA